MDWKKILQYGSITGVAIWYVCLVGMVETFNARVIVDETLLTLGRALMVVISLGMGYVAATKLSNGNPAKALASSFGVGIIGAAMTMVLIWAINRFEIRNMFVNASASLNEVLTFDMESLTTGAIYLGVALTALAVIGGAIYLLPHILRRATLLGLGTVLLFGMLEDLLTVIFARASITESLSDVLYGRAGLSGVGAVIIFLVVVVVYVAWASQGEKLQKNISTLPKQQRQTLSRSLIVLSILFLLFLPQAVGPYISQILVLVGLYALMGLGLNIEIGLAGLLDLGFVGFFAIGAYTVAILTSTGETTSGESITSFWVAVPLAVTISAFAGVFLGIPVLRMRGDYLAIVTLGFAEIIRILVLSNFLQPLLGGAQGVLNVPKPLVYYVDTAIAAVPAWMQSFILYFFSAEGRIKDPQHFYYIIVLGCIFISFVAWRLQNARVGRNWMALREDEDVAEAMGINLIASKLLAFGIGAAFAGLSGAIFAAQVGSVFPHSFGLIVSINVVSLVIIGGSGSIPGVIVGSLVLVGLPELLREFAEYRLLIYGALLVVMMLVKPEGLWPSEVSQREMVTKEEENPVPAGQTAGQIV